VSAPLIRAVDLRKEYGFGDGATLKVLHGLDFTIDVGEFVAIMGPSGSGKSTLMNILGSLDVPTGGHYFLDGFDTATLTGDQLAELRNRTIGFVFQGFNLLARKSVEDNVALPMVYGGAPRGRRREDARRLLELVGLSGRGGHHPNQLSGGQQQRVAIARALANRPRLILADEPTGNLDTQTSEEIMSLFEDLNFRHGLTVIIVTHEADVARHARRLIHIVDGRIAEDGPVNKALGAIRL
jgi:putative ABC transport system ATP-binding protein